MNLVPRESVLVREEVEDLRTYLDGLPSELGDGPFAESYRQRLEVLELELYLADSRHDRDTTSLELDLRLQPPARGHRVRAGLLGLLVGVWQDLIDALGQAACGRATARGAIPHDLRKQTELDVVAFAPGSFVVRLLPCVQAGQMELSCTEDEPLVNRAFNAFVGLVEASDDEQELAKRLHALKGRVALHYGRLLDLVDQGDMGLQAVSRTPGDERYTVAALRPAAARARRAMLRTMERSLSETIEFTGTLTGANVRTRRFELDIGDEGVVPGVVAAELSAMLHDVTIGRRYRVRVVEEATTQVTTGEVTSTYQLKSIDPVE